MELKILGSSSAGNCYVFDNGMEALILECGISFEDVKRSVNFDISRIVGCVVSHEHGDHAKEVQKFLNAHIPVHASAGTIKAIKVKSNSQMLNPIEANKPFTLGNFKILAFDVQHDAAQPFGFLISHPETGITLFATDTYYLAYKFKGLNNILIECNYRLDILRRNLSNGSVPIITKDRIIESHMSYDTCLEVLLANDLSDVNNIVLIHLSDSNSNALEFHAGIKEATGKNVHIADRGVILKFNKTPF